MIWDLETQIHVSHKRRANPWHPDNFIVMRGWKKQGAKQASWRRYTSKEEVEPLTDELLADVTMLVGHNCKFDLLYEMQSDEGRAALKRYAARGGRIFCTQYAEYLLQAQDRKYHMNAMDDIAESYGGRTKIDQIKALWAAGVQTSEIDPDLLADYLVGTEEEGRNSGDIGNTEKIFLGQIKAAKELGMFDAILQRMEGLAATTEMEFNGIKIDYDRAMQNLAILNKEREEVDAKLQEHISFIPDEVGFSWGSIYHKSALLYGGTIKYQKREPYTDEKTGELARKKEVQKWPLFDGEPVKPAEAYLCRDDGLYYRRRVGCCSGEYSYTGPQDTFKSGKRMGEGKFKNVDVPGELKIKWQDFFFECPGVTTPKPEWKGALTDCMGKPLYGTGSDIIEELGKRDIPFLKDMARLNALDKEIGTYYIRYDEKKKEHVGMLTCMMDDGIVHHSLNHTSTVTTRLSANNPNAQNFPRGDKSDLKAVFVSRFGPKGRMIEADYSQLEVVVQGLLSLDKQLVEDLNNRIDFHCKRVAAKYGCSYEEALVWCKDEDASPDYALWKKRRTGVKEFSFQRAYGAGAAAISDATGLDIDTVKDLIAAEEAMYPGIEKFNAGVAAAVNETAEPFRAGKDEGYQVYRKGYWQGPTGTMYGWRSYDAPSFLRKKGITDTFKPPELKNYPVQGTGGEIVQMIIGRLWRVFMKKNNWGGKALLVNTVHDCIWVDCHEDVLEEVASVIKKVMESVPQMLEKIFGIHCPVPFPVDVEAGPNMLDLHHVEV
jgi:DNA polymerase I-like protein with 3'-5' exonuclease and polymerase domains